MPSSYYSAMVAHRRQIHARPEEGWTEFETTWHVAKYLRELGLDVQVGKAVILDDGIYHYAVAVLVPSEQAGEQEESIRQLLDSVQLE